MGNDRDEWLRLMLRLAELDRDAYREVRADAWNRVVKNHGEHTPEQRARWLGRAS